jgi:abequosyltransferase
MIPGGLRLHYLPESYLFKRTENDSFVDKGLVHRYAIGIDGYHRLADTHFPVESLEAQHIRRAVRNEFPPWLLLRLKFTSEREQPDDLPAVDRLAAKAYRDRTPLNLAYRLIYKHTPRAAFRAAQATYRPVRSIITSIRRLRPTEPPAAAR